MCDASYKLPEYLRRTAYGTKPDPDGFDLPIQYALGFKQSFFDWLETQPDRRATFNLAIKSISLKTVQALVAYPFNTELGQNPPSTEDEVLLVDVGGGRGHVAEVIRENLRGMKGRIIVQDLKGTIDEIQAPKDFEPMVHDFFTPQPIKGARAYFFSRILHDWSDYDCRRILEQTASAMRPGHSRVLISDIVVPEKEIPPLAALIDINMLLIGGMERNRKQWSVLLEGAGLRLEKVWTAGPESIIEARLKD
jgi:O-methyltransferase domain